MKASDTKLAAQLSEQLGRMTREQRNFVGGSSTRNSIRQELRKIGVTEFDV